MKIKGLLLLGCLLGAINMWGQAPSITDFGNATPGYNGDKVAQIAGCGSTTADNVSISGSNFTVSGLQVFLGTIQVAIITSNATYLEFLMPNITTLPGIKTFSNQLKVQTSGGSTTSTGTLFASFCLDNTPINVPINTQFEISGTDLASITNISFTGGSILEKSSLYTYNTVSGNITIPAPTVAGNTFLTLVQNSTNQSTTPNLITFIVPVVTIPAPNLSALPIVGLQVGDLFTIQGTNFSNTSIDNKFFVGGIQATTVSASTTQITARIPIGSTYDASYLVVAPPYASANYSVPLNIIPNTATSILGTDFIFAAKLSGASNQLRQIEFADMNADGKPDMIVQDFLSGETVSIFINNAAGNTINGSSFGAANTLNGGSGLGNIGFKIADMNNDGKLDVIVNDGSILKIFIQQNNGTSYMQYTLNIGDSNNGFDVSDFNGDGKQDIVTVGLNGANPVFYRNQNSGNTFANGNMIKDFTLIKSTKGIQIADFDGDSKPDLLINNFGNSNYEIFRNTSIDNTTINGTTFSTTGINITNNIVSEKSILADFDLDGKLDLAIMETLGSKINIFRNTSSLGNISFQPFQTISIAGTSAIDIDVQHINGDAYPDLVLVGSNPASMLTYISTSNAGTISFTLPISTSLSVSPFTNNTPRKLNIVDIDADNKPDIAVSFSDGFVYVYRNSTSVTTCTTPIFASQPIAPPVFCQGSSDVILSSSVSGTVLGFNWQTFNYNLNIFQDLPSEVGQVISILGNSIVNQARYRLKATNDCGTNFSSFATITVASIPVLLNNPSSPGAICQLGGSVIIIADVSVQSVNYTWQSQIPFSSTWTDVVSSSVFQGVNSQTLTINNPLLSLNGFKFRIRLDGNCISTTTGLVSDGNATLTVFGSAPIILTQPQNSLPICSEAGSAIFNISVVGVDLSFQWEEFVDNWTPLVESYYYRGTIENILTINDLDTLANGRKYRVKVTGACSQLFSYSDGLAQINIYKKPVIIPTIAQNCFVGESKLAIDSVAFLTQFNWKIDSAVISSGNLSIYFPLVDGVYSVFVNNNPRCASNGFDFKLPISKPQIIGFGTPRDTLLSVSDSGKYQWYVNDRLIQGAKAKSLVIHYNGKYLLSVVYPNGCMGISNPYIVKDPSYLDVLKSDAEYTDSTIILKKSFPKKDLKITPNPSTGTFTLTYMPIHVSFQIYIFDMSGNIVYSENKTKNNNREEINIPTINAGIYQLKVVDGDSMTWSKLVIY